MRLQNQFLSAAVAVSVFCLACNETGSYNDNRDGMRDQDGETAAATLSNREVNFIEDALEANATSIFLLQDAINNGTDAAVKSEASKMIAEQNALRESLRSYAQNHRISLNDVELNDREEIDSDPGIDWDKEWADETADIHRAMIRKFERADRFAEQEDLKVIIRTNLPKLRSNLEIAENLESRLD